MSSSNWVQAILPCLRPRSAQKARLASSNTKDLQSLDSTADTYRNGSVPGVLPLYEDGLEPVVLSPKSRRQTVLITELPCPTPEPPIINTTDKTRQVVGRSKSDGLTYKRKDAKSLKGKRKRSQTLNISGPSNVQKGPALAISGPSDVRQGPSNDPKLSFPLTYPSPSRQRPLKPTMDRRDPSSEQDRPRTAPSGNVSHDPSFTKSVVMNSLRSDSFQIRSHAWRLAPLPPMPALDIETQNHARSGSGSGIKRKPVPLRIRGNSSPPTPTTAAMTTSTTGSNYPIGSAIEMPGCLPPTAKKSPIELATSKSPAFRVSAFLAPPSPVETGPDTPLAELDSAAEEAASHTRFSTLPTSPTTPTSPIYAHRLSEGARDLLNFFPTTPRLVSRANSVKTVATRPASTPPLSPRLVEYAESKFSTFVSAKAVEIDIKPGQQQRKETMVSPSAISPRMTISPLRIKHSPPLHAPDTAFSFGDKDLPPTPETAGFSRGRFISLAAGMEYADAPEFAGLDLATGYDGYASRKSSGVSVQIFMAATP